MTPEGRAARIQREHGISSRAEEDISNAIRAAVAEERERCAKIADNMSPDDLSYAAIIARRIRNTNAPPEAER